jgi:hypothetical protein
MDNKLTFKQVKEWQKAMILSNELLQAADDISGILHKIAEPFMKDIPDLMYEIDLTDMSDSDIKEMLAGEEENIND